MLRVLLYVGGGAVTLVVLFVLYLLYCAKISLGRDNSIISYDSRDGRS